MASTAFIGLIVLSNSLFLSNYIFIRSERNLADAKLENEKSREGTATDRLDEGASEVLNKDPRLEACLTGCLYGLCCGVVKKELNSVRKFHDWEAIRYRLGLLSTSALLILFTALFSEGVMYNLGANPGEAGTAQLCKKEEREDHMVDVNEILEEVTNLHTARRQYELTKIFSDALQNDTNLFGTHGHECPMYPRTKEEFHQSNGYGNESELHFFPGHCLAAQELALKSAREQTCEKVVCVDKTIEVEVPIVEDDKVQGILGYIKDGADGVVQMKKVQKHVRGCEEITILCPNHKEADKIDQTLQDYKWKHTQRAEEMVQIQASQVEAEYSEGVKETGEEVITTLVHQVDIASTLYVVYVCVSLFFPSPVYIFRSSYAVAAKRVVFGAQKHVFVLVVLVFWWGFKYFQSFRISLELQLYIQKILSDPCYGDADFLANASKALDMACNELLPIESEWKAMSSATRNILDEVRSFKESCQCNYPCVTMCEVMSSISGNASEYDFDSIHFRTETNAGFCDSCNGVNILLPDSDTSFLGNSTFCEDPAYAKKLFLDSASDTSYINGWELWVQSGLLATLLIKTFIANFGVAVMHLADPLSACNGEYEGPPSLYEFGRGHSFETLRFICESNLRMIAARRSLLWGGLANMCLLNIMASTFRTDDGQYKVPNSTGIALITAAVAPPLICFWFTRSTKQRIADLKGIGEDNASTDQELESSSSEDTENTPEKFEAECSA